MRVDAKPFSDVRVRQAMRLIVDRQQMIDQALSGYGRLGNDLYAPFDPAYAKDLPQREQDIDQAKSLLKAAGQEGLQVQLFTGDDIGSVGPGDRGAVRGAGQEGRRRRQGGQEEPPSTATTTSPTRSPRTSGTPATTSRRRRCGSLKGGTYNETHFDNPKFAGLIAAAQQETDEAKRNTLLQDAQEIEYNEGGYIIWGFRQPGRRCRQKVSGHQAEQVPAAGLLQLQVRLGLELIHGRRRDTPRRRSRRLRRRRGGTAPPRGRSGWPGGSGWPLLTLWLVSILVFVATTALGDPVRAILGKDYDADQARVAELDRAAQPRRVAGHPLLRLARRAASPATSAPRSPTSCRSAS